eukprot:9530896-Prorocentrum_lima.AAC.1
MVPFVSPLRTIAQCSLYVLCQEKGRGDNPQTTRLLYIIGQGMCNSSRELRLSKAGESGPW